MTTLLAALVIGMPQMPAEVIDAWAAPVGLQIVRVHVPEGDVVVYLPARIAPGETVAGSIYLEPAGEGRVDQARNEDSLQHHQVDVCGAPVDLDKPHLSIQAPDGGSLTVTVRNADGSGAVTGTGVVAGSGPGMDEPSACPVVEIGTAIRVVGRFDGRRESTMAYIDGVPAGILAEGSRDCVVSTMNAGVGPHKLVVKENGVESQHSVNVVRVDVTPPVDARIGKKTSIEVVVDGLEGADSSAFPLSVKLTNNAPKLFPFGSNAELQIQSTDVTNGRYSGKVEFKPKKKGQFSLSARLVCDAFLKRIML